MSKGQLLLEELVVKKILFLICFSLFFSPYAFAKDLYVATTGDDSVTYANNHIDIPWRTIDHGVATMLPGDILNVRGGTYSENVTVSTGGTAAYYKTIRNYPGETPTLDASAGDRGFDLADNVNYIKIIGFEIKNAKDWAISNAAPTKGRNNEYIEISHCDIHNNGDASGFIDYSSYEGGILLSAEGTSNSISNITIDNCEIHHNYRAGITIMYGDSNIVISNNLIYRNPDKVQPNGSIHSLTLAYTSNATLHDNYVYFSQKSVRIQQASNENNFYNNIIAYGGETGLDINANCNNNKINNNIIAFNNMNGSDIKSYASSNNIFWNNIFYNNSYFHLLQSEGSGGATTTRFENNIFGGQPSHTALYRESGIWGEHDYNNYYNLDSATWGNDGPQTIPEWIGSGNEEQNSVSLNPSFDAPDDFDFDTSIAGLQNTGNSPGICDEIGLCTNFVDVTKVFPYLTLSVHSASYDPSGATKTIDHKINPHSTSYGWVSNASTGWIIYDSGSIKKLKYIGISGACFSKYYSPNQFHIAVSTTGTDEADFTIVLNATYVDTSDDDWSQQAQWFELDSSVDAKYIKLIIDNGQKDYSLATFPNVAVMEFYAIGPRQALPALAGPTNLRIISISQ